MNMELKVSERRESSKLDAVMSAIKSNLRSKLFDIVCSREVTYVDYPVHGNTGDLLILSGALKFFKEQNIKIITYDNVYGRKYSELNNTPKHLPIICHGGGNFGDLYHVHQKFREDLVSQLNEHKIIVFPQSMHFSSEQALERSAAIFRKHRNFHFCVRDHESFESAQRFTDKVHLVPDCAHMLWGQFKPVSGSAGKLNFLREDIESTGLSQRRSVDWATMSDPRFYKIQSLMQRATKKLSPRPTTAMSKLAFAFWMLEVKRTMNDAYRHFSEFDTVETDRLHGMLFSLLLQKKVLFHDNSVKKLSRYKNTWLGDLSDNWITAADAKTSVEP